MAKFGIGQSVRRVEDPRSPHRRRSLHRRHQARPRRPGLRAALAACPCRHQEHRHIGCQEGARRPARPDRRGCRRKAGYGDLPCLVPVTNRDGTPRGETPRPMLAQDRVRHVGDPVALVVAETLGAGQGRGRADRGRLRAPPAHGRHLRIGPGRRAAGPRPYQGQPRLRLGDGRPRAHRSGLRQS